MIIITNNSQQIIQIQLNAIYLAAAVRLLLIFFAALLEP
jgi:hypothetical protein